MKRIFRRLSRLNSAPDSVTCAQEAEILHILEIQGNDEVNNDQPEWLRRRWNSDHNWRDGSPQETNGRNPFFRPDRSDRPDSPDTLSVSSLALSDSETLAQPRRHRLNLQDTYEDNFHAYLPYVLRRRRLERNGYFDDASVASSEQTVMAQQTTILGRAPAAFDFKRSLVVAREFIKSTTYVFPDSASFELFRQLRSSRKHNKDTIAYDADGNIRRLRSDPRDLPRDPSGSRNESRDGSRDGREAKDDYIIDTRLHIIPIHSKLKGEGLPLFKVVVPYMLSFRRKVPFMVFRRYLEVPERPRPGDPGDEDKSFESYVFCAVQVKTFSSYKRFVLHFTPKNRPAFNVLVFQSNYTPFADFNYGGTRFRVVGTALSNPYLLTYNPELKLHVLDATQSSLCDNVVNKQPGWVVRSSTPHPADVQLVDDPADLPNPVPSPTSPTLKYSDCIYSRSGSTRYIPANLPPFGRFLDACAYEDDGPFFPKKYNNVGTLELYQGHPGNSRGTGVGGTGASTSTTFSVEFDTLVLTTVLLALQETRVRNTTRYPSTKIGGRIGALSAGPPGMVAPTQQILFFDVL